MVCGYQICSGGYTRFHWNVRWKGSERQYSIHWGYTDVILERGLGSKKNHKKKKTISPTKNPDRWDQLEGGKERIKKNGGTTSTRAWGTGDEPFLQKVAIWWHVGDREWSKPGISFVR